MKELETDEREGPLPFRPGDWVADTGSHARIGRVRSVYRLDGDVLLDIVMYDHEGRKLGRASQAEGGPTTFEPACSAEGWDRIAKPEFPIGLRWIRTEKTCTARYWAGEPLPPAMWVRPQRRRRAGDDRDLMRRALEAIAAGHNDPRGLAQSVLDR